MMREVLGNKKFLDGDIYSVKAVADSEPAAAVSTAYAFDGYDSLKEAVNLWCLRIGRAVVEIWYGTWNTNQVTCMKTLFPIKASSMTTLAVGM